MRGSVLTHSPALAPRRVALRLHVFLGPNGLPLLPWALIVARGLRSRRCYKKLAEDDNWITGVMTMAVGEKDTLHHHKDHLIYVAEGDGVTIYPGGDESAPMVVPLQVGAGIPAPMSAPPFAKHTLLNSGTVPLKMIFFEAKK